MAGESQPELISWPKERAKRKVSWLNSSRALSGWRPLSPATEQAVAGPGQWSQGRKQERWLGARCHLATPLQWGRRGRAVQPQIWVIVVYTRTSNAHESQQKTRRLGSFTQGCEHSNIWGVFSSAKSSQKWPMSSKSHSEEQVDGHAPNPCRQEDTVLLSMEICSPHPAWGCTASSFPAHVKPCEAEMILLPSDTPVPLWRARQSVVPKILGCFLFFPTLHDSLQRHTKKITRIRYLGQGGLGREAATTTNTLLFNVSPLLGKYPIIS